jgi:hypothetical protein
VKVGLLDIVGSVLGTSNKFQAQAPKNTFQATGANLDESQYGDAIKAALARAVGGGGQGAVHGQDALTAALQAQMAGNGPSLAQRQLEQATQANAAQAAGAVAGVKGINPALAARMILQGQNAANQGAAGQAATLRQSEQLGTEGLLAQALATQRGQDIGQQQADTSVAGTAGGLQQGQNQTRVSNALGTQQINANVGEGNANRELGAQQINAGVAAQNTNTNAGILGGALQGAGAFLGLANGGEIHPLVLALAHARAYAGGGDVSIPQIGIPDYSSGVYAHGADALRGALAGIGKGRGASPAVPGDASMSPSADFQPQGSPTVAPWTGAPSLVTPMAAPAVSPLAGQGDLGPVPMAAGGGEIDYSAAPIGNASLPTVDFSASSDLMNPFAIALRALQGGKVTPYAAGGDVASALAAHFGKPPIDFRGGGGVPGRGKVPGDSPQNDDQPAVVSPKEIVLPRSVTMAPDAPDKAAAFVAAIQAKKKAANPTGYGAVLAAQRRAAGAR